MSVCCECCVLSGRGLCVGLIIRPEESYRLWCVVVCDLETSRMRRPWPTGGCCTNKKDKCDVSFIVRNITNKRIYRYVKLLYYKERSFLHVSIIHCCQILGGVL